MLPTVRGHQHRASVAYVEFPPVDLVCLLLAISSILQHLIPWARIGSPRADTQDPKAGKQLWEYLEEQVKNVRTQIIKESVDSVV